MLVMRVVSVVRRRRRLRGGADAFRRGAAATGTNVFGGRSGVTFVGRQTRFRRRSTAIAGTVAATGLSRVMLVRTRTPTMVSAAALRRTRRRDTVVGGNLFIIVSITGRF